MLKYKTIKLTDQWDGYLSISVSMEDLPTVSLDSADFNFCPSDLTEVLAAIREVAESLPDNDK